MEYTRKPIDAVLSQGEIVGHVTALAFNAKKLDTLLGEIKPYDHEGIVQIHALVERMKDHADELLNESSK
jgi:hypothetical protein